MNTIDTDILRTTDGDLVSDCKRIVRDVLKDMLCICYTKKGES